MQVTRLQLENWRNFTHVDVRLQQRVFAAGPNASGKSNLLDAFRFLKEVTTRGGGLEKAVSDRGGVSKIRCLAARRHSSATTRQIAASRRSWSHFVGPAKPICWPAQWERGAMPNALARQRTHPATRRQSSQEKVFLVGL